MPEETFHRTEVVQTDEEIVTIGYRWVVDETPFEGGYFTEEEVVIDRRPALRVVEESA